MSVSEYHSPDTPSTMGRVENYKTYTDPVTLAECVDEVTEQITGADQ